MAFPKNFIEFLNERSVNNETITIENVLNGLDHYYPEVMNKNKPKRNILLNKFNR